MCYRNLLLVVLYVVTVALSVSTRFSCGEALIDNDNIVRYWSGQRFNPVTGIYSDCYVLHVKSVFEVTLSVIEGVEFCGFAEKNLAGGDASVIAAYKAGLNFGIIDETMNIQVYGYEGFLSVRPQEGQGLSKFDMLVTSTSYSDDGDARVFKESLALSGAVQLIADQDSTSSSSGADADANAVDSEEQEGEAELEIMLTLPRDQCARNTTVLTEDSIEPSDNAGKFAANRSNIVRVPNACLPGNYPSLQYLNSSSAGVQNNPDSLQLLRLASMEDPFSGGVAVEVGDILQVNGVVAYYEDARSSVGLGWRMSLDMLHLGTGDTLNYTLLTAEDCSSTLQERAFADFLVHVGPRQCFADLLPEGELKTTGLGALVSLVSALSLLLAMISAVAGRFWYLRSKRLKDEGLWTDAANGDLLELKSASLKVSGVHLDSLAVSCLYRFTRWGYAI